MAHQLRVAVYLPERSQALVAALREFHLPVELVECDTEADAVRECPTVDILVALPINASAFRDADRLKWIQSLSAGIEGWIGVAPPEIPLTRMAGVFERYMTEYVFAYLLHTSQGLRRIYEAQAKKAWSPFNTRSLSGVRMGIAGAGVVGQAVAKLAKSFGMTVTFFARTSRRAAEVADLGQRFYVSEELSQFLAEVDVLVITLPATPGTDRMFGYAEFAMLPHGATVINIGRGLPVDEDGLVRALRDGLLSEAIIDTFRTEPLTPDSPLWDVPNLTITPHMAGAVYPPELAAVVATNIRTFLGGQVPEPMVDPTAGY